MIDQAKKRGKRIMTKYNKKKIKQKRVINVKLAVNSNIYLYIAPFEL